MFPHWFHEVVALAYNICFEMCLKTVRRQWRFIWFWLFVAVVRVWYQVEQFLADHLLIVSDGFYGKCVTMTVIGLVNILVIKSFDSGVNIWSAVNSLGILKLSFNFVEDVHWMFKDKGRHIQIKNWYILFIKMLNSPTKVASHPGFVQLKNYLLKENP